MKPPYRVQAYAYDMGAWHKDYIRDGISHSEYITQNVFHHRFYAILLPDDPYGERLPQTIRTYQQRVKICRGYENVYKEAGPCFMTS